MVQVAMSPWPSWGRITKSWRPRGRCQSGRSAGKRLGARAVLNAGAVWGPRALGGEGFDEWAKRRHYSAGRTGMWQYLSDNNMLSIQQSYSEVRLLPLSCKSWNVNLAALIAQMECFDGSVDCCRWSPMQSKHEHTNPVPRKISWTKYSRVGLPEHDLSYLFCF